MVQGNSGSTTRITLSPTLFNLFLQRITSEALEDLNRVGISCQGMNAADDIDLIGKDQREVKELTYRLHNTSGKFGIEVSKENSKTMVSGNGDESIRLEIEIDGGKLEQVKHFKYLGQRSRRMERRRKRFGSELVWQLA
eukprot:gene743-biopygen27